VSLLETQDVSAFQQLSDVFQHPRFPVSPFFVLRVGREGVEIVEGDARVRNECGESARGVIEGFGAFWGNVILIDAFLLPGLGVAVDPRHLVEIGPPRPLSVILLCFGFFWLLGVDPLFRWPSRTKRNPHVAFPLALPCFRLDNGLSCLFLP
jgi:hypothetical protein